MATYHAVSSDSLETFLQSKRFRRTLQGNEVVYVRTSERDANVHIKVYTSIKEGNTQVRRRGSDAVRVCVVWDDGKRSFGIGKFPKVLRTTSDEAVIGRVEERLGWARQRAIEWMNDHAPSANDDAPPSGEPV